jgi:tRNA(His) 5'-end guanylyltransferase
LRLGFKKLYDPNFTSAMANTVILFVRKAVSAFFLFAYTFSDEISFLFTDLSFEGKVEKLTLSWKAF